MNLIGIDASIDSTGMSIFRGDELILFNFTTMKRNVLWIKRMMEYVDFEFVNYTYKSIENYTEKEIMKLREFNYVTDLIINKIIGNIEKNEKTIIAIEGYNYGLKNTNSIVDIVSFSTLLRFKLLGISNLEKIIIVSPKSVKKEIAEKSYGFSLTKNGKKNINKNFEGTSGGNFDKKDILMALLNMNVENKLTNMLNKYKEDLIKLKNVPKGIDDVIDSFFIASLL